MPPSARRESCGLATLVAAVAKQASTENAIDGRLVPHCICMKLRNVPADLCEAIVDELEVDRDAAMFACIFLSVAVRAKSPLGLLLPPLLATHVLAVDITDNLAPLERLPRVPQLHASVIERPMPDWSTCVS
jgi:hypothetical protein